MPTPHTQLTLKLIATLGLVTIAAGAAIACYYGFVVKAEAESLLKDLTALRAGQSTEADTLRFIEKHKKFFVSRVCGSDYCVTSLRVENKWLAFLRLEPRADFYVSCTVANGKVSEIRAELSRSMPIYPTFPASAGMVAEYAEYPPYKVGHQGHYSFPTPVGKPYLSVELDTHATPVERERAFAFSFRCLVKPGWGCDLPCDYLPLAWQDWKQEIQESVLASYFRKAYPKSDRCGP